jgi:hypothetical protein
VKSSLWIGFSLLLAGGCAFKVNGGGQSDPHHDMSTQPGGGGGDLAGTDGAVGDMTAPPGSDLATGPDMAPVCVAGGKRCNGTALETCRGDGSGFDSTACDYGCGTSGGAHCKTYTPSAPVITSDFSNNDGTAVSLATAGTYIFDTYDGSITAPAGGMGRDANDGQDVSASEIKDHIGFRRASGYAVWSFASLTVASGVTVMFTDSNDTSGTTTDNQYIPAFAVNGAVDVGGAIDVRGYASSAGMFSACAGTSPGPGGGVGQNGGTGGFAAGGSGHGVAGTAPAGGSGGSYGGVGSLGSGTTNGGGAATYGNVTLSPLLGGSGGGAGVTAFPPTGGGGGGALEIASTGAITIEGTIDAGGCGGAASGADSGGGGGSGGAILVEGKTITLGGSSMIAANGGGGGGGGQAVMNGQGQPGDEATATKTPANGGSGGGKGGAGGNGGAAGSPSTHGVVNTGGNSGNGGGGGGVGRIRLNTLSGTASGSSDRLSPTVTDGQATVGTLSLQ